MGHFVDIAYRTAMNRMTSLLVITTFLVVCTHRSAGKAFYRELIPNGDRIPSPCNVTQIWHGVGHLRALGAGPMNKFGKDFVKAGHVSDFRLWHILIIAALHDILIMKTIKCLIAGDVTDNYTLCRFSIATVHDEYKMIYSAKVCLKYSNNLLISTVFTRLRPPLVPDPDEVTVTANGNIFIVIITIYTPP